MNEALEKFKLEYPEYKILYLTKYGSHLFGLNNEDSDEDYKGIFVAPLNDLILKKDISLWKSKEENGIKNTVGDVDFEMVSLQSFLSSLRIGELNSISILFSMFSDSVVFGDKLFMNNVKENYYSLLSTDIRKNLSLSYLNASKYGFLSKKVKELISFRDFLIGYDKNTIINDIALDLKHFINNGEYEFISYSENLSIKENNKRELNNWKFVHYSEKSFAFDLTMEYLLISLNKTVDSYLKKIKIPNNKDDWKSLSHSLRALFEAIELVETNFITYPLLDKELLKNIKEGKIEHSIVMSLFEEKTNLLNEILVNSKLPVQNENLANKLIIKNIKESYERN